MSFLRRFRKNRYAPKITGTAPIVGEVHLTAIHSGGVTGGVWVDQDTSAPKPTPYPWEHKYPKKY